VNDIRHRERKIDNMKKKLILVVIAAICVLVVALVINAGKPEEGSAVTETEEAVEEGPEQRLVGIWLQTQEYLDYENEYIHSASVTVTEKERLEFRKDGTCELTNPYRGTDVFTYEYRNGSVILMADGWAPQRYLLDGDSLIDPGTGIAKYEKQ